MELVLVILSVAAFIFGPALLSLRRRLDDAEERLTKIDDFKTELSRLTHRVVALERTGVNRPVGPLASREPVSEPREVAVAETATAVVLPTPEAELGADTVPDVDAEESEARPAWVPRGWPPIEGDNRSHVLAASEAMDAPVAVTVPFVRAPEAPTAPVIHEASPADAAPEGSPSEAWEVVVGTSWLNKIGVLIFVTGLALLLGYSMTNVGPLGRVMLGLALSASMLGAGVAIERRDAYRAYGHGLVAGGWAGVYVTAFAMRAIPAAQVIHSDAVGLGILLVVAAGMVAHSLRYRSETVTALAYAAAYLPLAFTPLTTFSLATSIPLAASMLLVAQRFGWSAISVFGLVTTYGLFAMRGRVLPGVVPDPTAITPYLLLALYWLTFEAADIIGLRAKRPSADPRPAPLFALNAIGYLGALLMMATLQDAERLSLLLAMSAAAYVMSAFVRARLVDRVQPGDDDVTPTFSTVHASVALAAGMMAWAIDLRLAGPRETLALLFEAQLLVAASVTLRDRNIRRVATALACLVSAHVVFITLNPNGADLTWPWGMSSSTPVLALVATAWYFNREWLRRRAASLDPVEHVFTWISLLLIGLIISREFAPTSHGLAGLLIALVLFEAGVRRSREYLPQSYVALGLGVASVVWVFAFSPDVPALTKIWAVLPSATVLAYVFAWRASRQRPADDLEPANAWSASVTEIATSMAAVAACAGTAFVVILEWRVTPADWLGAVWSITAMALVALGAWKQVAGDRWQGYVLALAAALVSMTPLVLGRPMLWSEATSPAVVITLLYVSGYVGRRAAVAAGGDERHVAGLLPLVATATLTLLKWRVLPAEAVAPAWAATALVLVWLGHARLTAGQRWQGYAAAVLALVMVNHWATLEFLGVAQSGILPALVPTTALGVYLTAYLVTYLGRTVRRSPVNQPTPAAQLESALLVALPAFTTFQLIVFESQWMSPGVVPTAFTVTALALLVAGLISKAIDLRVQSYVVFGASTGMALLAIVGPSAHASVFWSAITIGIFYVTSLASRGPLVAAGEGEADATRRIEKAVRVALSAAATLLLCALIGVEVRPTLVTVGWGLQGTALLLVGFVVRERALRLAGLSLLFLCILKLFMYDLRELEALARITSFVVLGLVLLGVSWTYTRYKEQIKRLL